MGACCWIWLRGRAGDAVSETALEALQAGSRAESVALFDDWVERLGVLRREPGGASTLAAFLWNLFTVSPIEDARIIEAAEELPERVEEAFMTGLERLRRTARALRPPRSRTLSAGSKAF